MQFRNFGLLLLACGLLRAQPALPVKWEDLTSGDFVKAINQAQGTCVLPFGILEKHGPHLPLGSDLFEIRYAALHAAEREFAVVFPEYYFGQMFEARSFPGTLVYSARLQLELLQETTDEMARNGCKKIIVANGHGGNNYLLPFFAQSQLASQRDYVVYVFQLPNVNLPGRPKKKSKGDGHAGEEETSRLMVVRPDLVKLDRAGNESGARLNRQGLPPGIYTGIGWYASFPNHYAGDGSVATKELGEFDMIAWSDSIANAIRAVKADQVSLQLQYELFEKRQSRSDTAK